MEPIGKIPSAFISESEGYQRAMKEAWKRFTTDQKLDPIVPPLIAASWRRCWGRVNPNSRMEFAKMGPDYLLASQTASFDLISIARPVMEDIYQCVQHSGSSIVLTNGIGCVLDVVGDDEITKTMNDWGIGVGSILSEEQIGTTSFGLALAERMPVQVAGREHFVQQFHVATGAAAPMFDVSGRLLGILGIVMPIERYHIHSLGLVAAAARAIESQRQSDVFLAEQNSQLRQLNTILSTISDGILVWSANNILVHANNAASNMLGIPLKSLVGQQAEALFKMPAAISKAVLERKPMIDVEGVIDTGGQKINCLISVEYVYKSLNELQWMVFILRSEKKVRKLVQNQVGANATLTLDDIPGDSPQMHKVRNFVRSAASAQASILIRGEVGTGKNALASAIHNAGNRRDGPFVIFSCSSIPNELVISELLGYDEDTSHQRSGRPSKFELAEGGTLFFQDVDALPLEAQAVLLNALELRMVQRLGSHRAIDVDVRIIASTLASVEKLISQGAFRSDLYYRLSTFTVTLPPLRNRPRDIPLVVDRILTRLKKQLGYEISLTPEVMDVFKKYLWPGNIRELEAVSGRAAIQMASAGAIGLAHIPGNVRRLENNLPNPQPSLQVGPLDEMERETILLTMQMQRGNISRMAQVLGVGRTTLWRKLKAYGIDPKEYR